MGFLNKNSRMNHESLCAYRTNESQSVLLQDSQSNDTQIASVDDWMMNLEVARANQNENNHPVGHPINDQFRDIAGKTSEEDYGCLWPKSLEDLDLQAALNQMDMDLNPNPEQDTPQGQEVTSIWDLPYK